MELISKRNNLNIFHNKIKDCLAMKELQLVKSVLITDAGIKHLASCHNLEILNINNNTNLTDLAFQYISEGCPQIKKIFCQQSSMRKFSEISYK